MGLDIFFKPRTLDESLLLNNSTKHLLLIGLSRTGTSILQRILNVYPRIFVTYESIYSPFLAGNNRQDIYAYYYEILKQYKHCCMALHPEIPYQELKSFSFEKEYEYFGDKAIYNTSPQFRTQLKHALDGDHVDKIIFTLRDPKARIASLIKWYAKRNKIYKHTAKDPRNVKDPHTIIMEQCSIWNQFVLDMLECKQNKSKSLILVYEDFVTDPEKSINSILDFLELDRSIFPSENLKTVKQDSVDKWRKDLDPDIIQKIETLTQPYFERLLNEGLYSNQ